MIFVIGFPVLWAIGFFIYWYRDTYWRDGFDLALGLVFGSVMAVLFGIGVGIVVGSISGVEGEYVRTSEADLQQLSDGSQVSGSFFLGSGQIDGDAVFYYYQENDGYYTLEHSLADNSLIVETTRPPFVAYETFVQEDSIWGINHDAGHERRVFYVPEGSITNNYVLNGPTE